MSILNLSSLKWPLFFYCCCPHCRCHHLGYSVPPALHRTIWCRSTFGPRGPGLSNPTYFLRPALPMAPTTDDNARDKRNILRPNPVTFLRDCTLYMTTNYAIIWKRCLNYITCLTYIRPVFFIKDARFRLNLLKNLVLNGLRMDWPCLVSKPEFRQLIFQL